MPRAPKESKNEKTLKRELARAARRLHGAEQKRDATVERLIDHLTEAREQQTRRARQAEHASRQAEHASRQALALLCEVQTGLVRAAPVAPAPFFRPLALASMVSVREATVACMLAALARLLFL